MDLAQIWLHIKRGKHKTFGTLLYFGNILELNLAISILFSLRYGEFVKIQQFFEKHFEILQITEISFSKIVCVCVCVFFNVMM